MCNSSDESLSGYQEILAEYGVDGGNDKASIADLARSYFASLERDRDGSPPTIEELDSLERRLTQVEIALDLGSATFPGSLSENWAWPDQIVQKIIWDGEMQLVSQLVTELVSSATSNWREGQLAAGVFDDLLHTRPDVALKVLAPLCASQPRVAKIASLVLIDREMDASVISWLSGLRTC